MTGTMTWAAMDVHARSIYAASMDVMSGELTRQRFDTGAVEPVVAWLAGLPGPVRACYEAGPTGFGLYRAAGAAGIDCQVIAPIKDAAAVGRSQQVRSPRHRPVVASADGRRADGGRGPVSDLGGGEGPGPRARAGACRFDALPPQALQAAVAPRPRVGPQHLDSGAPPMALSTDLRASQHRAGVHRQPRRLRRARNAQTGTRRAALLDRDRPRVLAGRPPLARVSWDRHALGADHRARGLRLHPVSARGATRIVAGAGALAPAIRRDRCARVDHQDRLALRPADPGRGRLAARPPTRASGARSTSARRGSPAMSCRSLRAPSSASTACTSGCGSARSPAT